MRLDKYLKVSRLIKRRTVANEACDAEKVLVNGKVARASYDVKAGDIIEINMGQKALKVKVEQVLEHALKGRCGFHVYGCRIEAGYFSAGACRICRSCFLFFVMHVFTKNFSVM